MNDFITNTLSEIAELINQKNHDYGDAYAKACNLFAGYPSENVYSVSKIMEKAFRIYTLGAVANQVPGEGLEDALKDCIGYCILYLNELNNRKNDRHKN